MLTDSLDSLVWIKAEIERSLETARRRLDAYSEAPDKPELFAEFAEHLHQAAGSLAMLELHGGSELTGQMEALAEAIREERLAGDLENFELLMRGCLELSDYLEELLSGAGDPEALLLSVTNEIRARLGRGPVVRERVGRARPRLVPTPAGEEDMASLATQLHPEYQAALLAFYHGEDKLGAVARMARVVARLEVAAASPAMFELLWILGGLLEALKEGGLVASRSIKQILGQFERELNRLAAGLEDELAPPNALADRMLAEIEQSSAGDERVAAIRAAFQLENVAATWVAHAAVPGSSLLASAGGAVLEDLGRVRDRIDIFVRTGSRDIEDLAPLDGMLKKVSDALSMLGLETARVHIEEQREAIRGLVEDEAGDATALLGVATGLVGVEGDVEAWLAGHGDDPATLVERNSRIACLREALADISRIKETFSECVRSGTIGLLEPLPRRVEMLAGSLDFLALDEAAALMRRIGRYIASLAAAGALPGRNELDRLADAVVSVEYWLETLQRGRQAPASMLENADRALRVLEAEPVVAPKFEPETELGVEPEAEAEEALEPEVEVTSASDWESQPDTQAGASAAEPIVEAQALPPVREPGADPEIVAVFMDEAAEVNATLAEAWPSWRDDPGNRDALAVIRRSFHTLKGSGRMVHARRLGEFAWSCESLLNRVIDYTLPAEPPVVAAVGEAISAVAELIVEFDTNTPPSADVEELFARIWQLVQGAGSAEEPTYIGDEPAAEAETDEAPVENPEEEALWDADFTGESELEEEPEAEAVAEEPEPEGEADETALAEFEPIPRIDALLYGIYRRDTESNLAVLDAWLEAALAGDAAVSPDLRQAAHALADSAARAGVDEMAALFSPLDAVLTRVGENEAGAGDGLVAQVEQTLIVGRELLAACADASLPLPDWESRVAALEAFNREIEELSPAETARETEGGEPEAVEEEEAIEEAPEVEESGPGEEAGAVEEAESVEEAQATEETEATEEEAAEETERAEGEAVEETESVEELAEEVTGEEEGVAAGSPPETVDRGRDASYDAEIAQVFVGEAGELLDGSDAAVHAWSANHDLTEPLAELLRRLHTLKGGARMVGLIPLADLVHELESLLIQVSDGRIAVSGELLHLVERALDRLHQLLSHVPGGGELPLSPAILAELREFARSDSEDGRSQEVEPEPEAETAEGAEDHEEVVVALDERELQETPQLRHEMARVRADLLESSINNSGEVSIYRGRIEQQLLNMGVHLSELDRTVERLRNQLRELEIETEAQILSSYAQRPQTADRGFDPLELDRYTRIHELSRSLAEAVSDLTSLRGLFAAELRQADLLLERQGRVNADLQDALMHTRMVPFALSAPRLRRLVRQVAEENGKRVAFGIRGTGGEMDRQMLGHILPALEHMLRNAVVHGIEDPALRAERGKPVEGQILLELRQDGGDMLIEVSDDGGGLDLEAIRARALEENLVEADAELTEAEISALVFRAGFTTATDVTQSAGRGVGMDVVAAEARQVGGSAEIHSTSGRGTRCRLRLPVTLAITQVLMVRVGRTRYPVALSSIGAVARLTQAELEELLNREEPVYEYGGEAYRLVSLARILGEELPPLEEQAARQPLLLVNVGGRRLALIAEDMAGSREIVVKPVGPQIARIPGLAGATIFGDGSIGLLLDLSALVRAVPQAQAQAEEASPPPVEAAIEEPTEPLVMIVDDSITVRRVTRHLLERSGLRVTAARDGLEALEMLQDHLPDVMLLDIEMPRMDGYELAGLMRKDERLSAIPIIVITSRTGEKHRSHAEDLGIAHYLGKPWQDSALLEAIAAVVPRFSPLPARDLAERAEGEAQGE